MRLQFSVRTVVYSVAALVAVVVAVFVLSVYLRGWSVPSSVIHSGLFRNYAARLGVSYSLASLRIGCFREDCPEVLTFSGLDVELATPESLKVHLGNVLARRGGAVNADDLRVQLGTRPPLLSARAMQADLGAQTGGVAGLEIGLRPEAPIRVDAVDVNAGVARADIRGVRLPLTERSVLDLDQLRVEGWSRSSDDWIALNRIAMDGMRVELPTRTSNLTVCKELPASMAVNRGAVEPLGALPGFLANALGTIREDLFRLAVVTAAVLAILKLLSVLWLKRWLSRLALAVLPAAAPFVFYFSLRSGRTLLSLVLIASGVLLAIAVACRVFVYRRGARWYQRWEPLFVDAAAVLVLLPLMGYGLELPTPPAGPRGVRIEELASSGLVIEPPGQREAISVPPVLATSISLSIPGSSPDVEATIASLRLAPMQISLSDSLRVALSPTMVERIRIVFDASRMESRSIFAHVRAGGSFAANGLLPALQDVEFLKGIGNRVGPLGFAVDLTASSPDLQSPVSSEFGTSPEAVVVNAALDLDPVECAAAFRLATRLATRQLTLVANASGDADGVNLSSFGTQPGSAIEIAQGSGSVRFAPATSLRINVASVHVPSGAGGAPDILVQSAGVTASLPPLGRTGPQTARIEIGPTTVTTSQGVAVRVDAVQADYDGQGDRHAAAVDFGATSINRPLSAPARFANARLNFNARAGQQAVELHIGDATVGGAQGPTLRIAGARVAFDRSSGGATVPVSVRTRVEDLRYDDRTDGVIQVDFPLLEATIQGQTSPEIPPRTFDGTADLRILEANSARPILAFDNAIVLSLNFSERRIVVPTQQITLRETVVSRTPSEIPFRLTLSGEMESNAGELTARLGLPRIELNRGSFRFSANDLDLTTRNAWNENDSSASLRYSGNLHLQLPRGPSAICLEEVSMVEVATSGTASGLAGGAPLPVLPVASCVSVPTLPEAITTRIAGVAEPGRPLEFGNNSGRGIRIRQLRSALNDVQIQRGHLTRLGSSVEMLGIQNLRGEGALDLKLDVFQDDSKLQLEGWALAGDGTRLWDLAAVATASRATVDAIQRVPASRLLDAAGPVLSDLGLSLQGLAPEARLADFHVEAGFEGDELKEAEIAASFSGGPIVAVANPDLTLSASSSPTAAGPTFKMRVERQIGAAKSDRFVANVEIPRTEIGVATKAGLTAKLTAGLRAEARGSVISDGSTPSSPVMANMAQVVQSLGNQVERISTILASQETTPVTPATAMNTQWDFALRQIDPGRPFLRLTPEVLETHASSVSFNAEWGAGSERSRAEGSGAMDAVIALDSSLLLLDARTPMNAKLTRPDNSEFRIAADLPIQALFSPGLMQAPQSSGALWSTDCYTRFWAEHPSRFLQREIVSPLNLNRVEMGPVSLRQAVLATTPLQLAVGYADSLQLDMPVTGRALYGSMAGRFQANVAPSSEGVSMDVRMDLDLKNIQAGAIAMRNAAGYTRVVEDEFNVRVAARTDNFVLDRASLAAMQRGLLSESQLQSIGLSVSVERAQEAKHLSGVFQASTGMQMNLVNEVLNRIAEDLRLSGPPRSMTYKDLAVKLDVERGVVQHKEPFLRLDGLQLVSTNLVEVDGTVKAHLGRSDERVRLSDLIAMMRGIAALVETD